MQRTLSHGRRAVTGLLLALWFASGGIGAGYAAGAQATSQTPTYYVYLNNKPLAGKGYLLNGEIYLPFYPLAKLLNLALRFSASGNTLLINSEKVTVSLYNRNGIMLFPLKTLSRAGNFRYRVDAGRRVVYISAGTVAARTQPPAQQQPAYQAPPQQQPAYQAPPSATRPPETSGPFNPVMRSDGVFEITVTDMSETDTFRDFYKPNAGNRFVIVYVTQRNISNELQIYTGKFTLADQNKASYDYMDGLSNFWLIVLRPLGANFGYLVFEIPASSRPAALVLGGLNRTPLSVDLGQGRSALAP